MHPLILSNTALFRGAAPEETEAMRRCLGSERRVYPKGARILRAGERTAKLGIVLSGRVLIQSGDLWGNTTVLDNVLPGQIFAETYACTGEVLLVDAAAAEDTTVLFLDVSRVLQLCPDACAHHRRLVANLLHLSAQKNLNLSRKILHTSAKSIRGRLLSYFSDLSLRCGSRAFTIPFNRQQLADYLNVDRSALSHELSKMQKEGLLRIERSRVTLLHGDLS